MDSSNASFKSVLKSPGFINLWVNQILVQLAYNSLNFTLIIWVYKITNSNAAVSGLLFAVYLPAVILGLFAGVIVDITDRKKVINIVNLLLCLAFASLTILKVHYTAVLFIAFFVNTLAQFYTPAESSAIPLLAKKEDLLSANSLFSITLYSTFLLGFGLAGPLISLLGIDWSFGLGAIFLATAFLLSLLFPSITTPLNQESQLLSNSLHQKNLDQLRNLSLDEIKKTLNLIRKHLPILACIFIMSGVQIIIGVMAVLIPSFLERVIHISATDASYVLVIPLGLGMITGGFTVGKFGDRLPKRRIVGAAILLAGLLFFTVGIAPVITPAIRHLPMPPRVRFFIPQDTTKLFRPFSFIQQPPLSTILGIGSFLLGMCLVGILVPTQTVLQLNSPEEDRGKIFAAQAVAMSGLSLIPVLFVGILADMVGTMPIFIAMGGTIAIIGWFTLRPNFFFDQEHLSAKLKQFLGQGHWRS